MRVWFSILVGLFLGGVLFARGEESIVLGLRDREAVYMVMPFRGHLEGLSEDHEGLSQRLRDLIRDHLIREGLEVLFLPKDEVSLESSGSWEKTKGMNRFLGEVIFPLGKEFGVDIMIYGEYWLRGNYVTRLNLYAVDVRTGRFYFYHQNREEDFKRIFPLRVSDLEERLMGSIRGLRVETRGFFEGSGT